MSDWKSKLDFNPIFSLAKGESCIGLFTGTREVAKISSKLHSITINEIDYDMYGCGSLDAQLADVKAGTEVKILYSGKKRANIDINGKITPKEVHNYTVFTKED